MVYAFGLIVLAGLLRVLTGIYPAALGSYAYSLAALVWCSAYGLFAVCYYKILTSPRLDGKDG